MQPSVKYNLVLELGNGKYWVAETTNVKKYKNSLSKGGGSEWIKKYEYIRVLSEENDVDNKDKIIELMKKYGKDNVRGTKYPRETLNTGEISEINGAFIGIAPYKSKNFDLIFDGKDKSARVKNTLYVLKLKEDKYYVGVTNDLERRLEEHKSGNGSAWTSVYKFESLVETRECKSIGEEDMVTKEYMQIHGINNVRGGAHCNINLDNHQIMYLKREIAHMRGICCSCGDNSHYTGDCSSTSTPIIITQVYR